MATGYLPARRAAEELEQYHQWARVQALLADAAVFGPGPERDLHHALLALKTGKPATACTQAAAGLAGDPGSMELHAVAAAAAWQEYRLSGDPKLAYTVRDHCLVIRRDLRFLPLALRLLAQTAPATR